MKKLWVLVSICLVGMLWWHFREITVAYRLTLEVEVNGETHAGSGVIVTYWGRNANPLAAWMSSTAAKDRGEAVPVDLGRYGLMFVTLRGKWDLSGLPMAVYGSRYAGDFWNYLLELGEPKPPREIPHADLPLLVHFGDTSQPNSVECLDPDHMEASFPPGVKVKLAHATIQIVDEPATTGRIEKLLPWLSLPWSELQRRLSYAAWNKPQCTLNTYYLKVER